MILRGHPSSELPAAPAATADFPWPCAPELDSPIRAAGCWPRITVATPSFNQGCYLEAAIRSVLSQNYPNLEYIVIDGGSGDESIEILRKYSPWLSYWCSESDRGQAHALNKCLARASGEFFNWINADDLLAPGALFRVAEAARGGNELFAGVCLNFDSAGHQTRIRNAGLSAGGLILGHPGSVFHQPALWWRRSWIERCGGIDERFDLAFDYDLLLRYLHLRPRIGYTEAVLAAFRLHPGSKTCSQVEAYAPERERILRTLAEREDLPELRLLCRRRLRQLRWWRELDLVSKDATRRRIQGAVQLALRALADPGVRLNRLTLGAIRDLLRG